MNKKNQELQIGMKSYEKDFLKQIICQISPYENWHIAWIYSNSPMLQSLHL